MNKTSFPFKLHLQLFATRAAIAHYDRKSKEDIADKDRRTKEKVEKRKADIAEFSAHSQHLANSAKAVKDLSKAAGNFGGLVGGKGMQDRLPWSSNHPQWYKNLDFSDVVTSLPSWYRAGTVLFHHWYSDTDVAPAGIAVINYVPTLPNNYPVNTAGNTAWKTSPINMCLTRFMSQLRKRNSRVGEYDAFDLGLYWFAASSAMEEILCLGKAIKAYNTYYADNAYFTKTLIQAIGFDPDDFFAHIAEYKILYNKYINIFNESIVIPKDITFMQRRAWMASAVVRDRTSSKSQIYIFRPAMIGTLADNEDAVNFVTNNSSPYNYTLFENTISALLLKLLNSVGIVTMTADLRAAFEPSELLSLPLLHGDETLEYSDSEYDLEQIHNIKTLPIINSTKPTVTRASIRADSASGCLFQGNKDAQGNVLPLAFVYTQNNVPHSYMSVVDDNPNQWLNFYDSKRTADDDSILEATRLRLVLSTNAFPGQAYNYIPISCGTEIALNITMYLLMNQTVVTEDVATDMSNDGGPNQDVMLALSYASAFDWFPPIRYYDNNEIDGFITFGEIDHPVTISNVNLSKLHEFCAYSEFTVK